jgi:hypothetical protein
LRLPTCRGYGLRSFRADLKELVRRCGLEGRRCLLLLEEQQLFDEGGRLALGLAGGCCLCCK